MTQDWSLTPNAPAPPKPKGKGLIISGAVLLVLGLILGIVGIAGTVGAAARLVSSLGTPSTTPATITKTLDAGTTYAVYAEATGGTGTTDDPFTSDVSVSDISVTGPGGSSVPVSEISSSITQTVDSNGGTFGAIGTFTPPTTGEYTVNVGGSGATVVVAPDLLSIGKSFASIALIPVGILVGLVGLILLIVGLVRRSSSKRALAQPGYAMGTGYASGAGYAGPGYNPAAPPAPVPPVQPPSTPPPPAAPPAAAPPPAAPLPPPAAPLPPPVVPPATPAGWYPDPQRPGGQRYWDGTSWTEHRA